MRLTLSVFFFFIGAGVFAQTTLPYREMPTYSEKYTASTVAARMIDGVGFRFYWATEGLRLKDLNFRPGPSARTSLQTIEHIYSMSFIVLNTVLQRPNVANQAKKASFADMRKMTLDNLRQASDILRTNPEKRLEDCTAIFENGGETVSRPFWLLINGPISDCLWHIGQVVSFRRSSGNPFSEKVNLFTGTVSY